ncbi:PPC domain-containing protein [Trichocoleus sp. FACHB-262]|uniref:PPC domain-containing protein n=1 Tax=Trichocoleus sp. FACHB-262 TaxID=2692869 RepID=UPI0018EFC30D|nr:PPC domain-containing protein [Trichocoleus sp. FACHB-262]
MLFLYSHLCLMRSLDFFLLNRPAACWPKFVLSLTSAVLASTFAPVAVEARSQLYKPPALQFNRAISDQLSNQDIPTGQGGFARDYVITCKAGEQITITVTSTTFDPMLAVISPDGSTLAENDDAEDGTTNAALAVTIPQSDRYTIRVQNFGQTTGGSFQLQVTRSPAQQIP